MIQKNATCGDKLSAANLTLLGDSSELRYPPDFHPLHDENIAVVVEAGTVRRYKLPRCERVASLVANPIVMSAITEMDYQLVIAVK